MLRLLAVAVLFPACLPSFSMEGVSEPSVFRFKGGESVSLLLEQDDRPVTYQQLVTSDGYISGPDFGIANIYNKTIVEATEIVREAIGQQTGRLKPKVSILIHTLPEEKKQRRMVYVLGAVAKPKAIALPFEQDYRLAACLAEAEGPTKEADLRCVKVLRGKKEGMETQTVDCSRFAREGQENMGPLLEPGDVVIVERGPAVTVTGEVLKPGVITRESANLPSEMPFLLSRALWAAGGLKPSGDRTQIVVSSLKPDGQLAITTYQMVGGKIENDPVLQSGDVVEVQVGLGITILGGVRSPGIYYEIGTYPMTLSRLVALAGGAAQKSKTNKVVVIRKSSPVPTTIDLDAVIEQGQLEQDIRLVPGDMVFVPSSTF